MDVKTYRAGTMQEALELVRRELGPTASVLQTREVRGTRLWNLLPGKRQVEVVASAHVNVPSRMPPPEHHWVVLVEVVLPQWRRDLCRLEPNGKRRVIE